ncbi:hypothetical protein [Streptomyces sp. UNOC14_S4]|nr:hypothetical protein [Streptomyces sp. UNOC14_S4]
MGICLRDGTNLLHFPSFVTVKDLVTAPDHVREQPHHFHPVTP